MTSLDDSALWTRYAANHDTATREELILRYVPLVRFVIGRLGIEYGAEYDDLVSQGLLGLIDAVDHYDLERGTSFSTYATYRIRGRILDGLRSLDVLSRPARQRVRQLQTAMINLHQQLGRPPEEEELAAHLGLEMETLRRTLNDSGRVLLSLDSPGEDDDSDLHESLPDDSESPLEALAENDLRDELMQAIINLPEREQQILSLYYREELTMKEIGHVLNLSESRVCQLHAKAVLTLRSALQTEAVRAESEAVL